jgi:ketopantoate reductase
MGAYAPSTLLDARLGRELEVETMFIEPFRRAQRFSAEVPALTRLIHELQEKGRM